MKKLFTLAVLSFITLAGFSQSDNGKIEKSKDIILGGDRTTKSGGDDGRDIILGRRDGDRNGDIYSGTDRNARVRDINREYDQKIRDIRNNRTLTSAEKERVIRRLEKERADRIRQVNGDNRYENNRGNRKSKVKHDNGKHKGWYKGKGNQKHDHNH